MSDRELAELLQSVEEHEDSLKERRKAIDNQAILSVIDGEKRDGVNRHDYNSSKAVHLRILPNSENSEDLNLTEYELVPDDEEEFEYYGEY